MDGISVRVGVMNVRRVLDNIDGLAINKATHEDAKFDFDTAIRNELPELKKRVEDLEARINV